MRVEFTAIIVLGKVDLGLVDEADNLNVVGSPHELNTCKGARRDDTSSVARFGAPGNLELLRFTDGGRAGRRSPETEIWVTR